MPENHARSGIYRGLLLVGVLLSHLLQGSHMSSFDATIYCLQDLTIGPHQNYTTEPEYIPKGSQWNETAIPRDLMVALSNPLYLGNMFAAYWWGYPVLVIPAGYATGKIRSDVLMCVSIGVASVITLLGPVFFHLSYSMTVVLRFLRGLTGGVIATVSMPYVRENFPNCLGLLTGFTFALNRLGSAISYPIMGALCTEEHWEKGLIIWGGIGLVTASIFGAGVLQTFRGKSWSPAQVADVSDSSNESNPRRRPLIETLKSLAKMLMERHLYILCFCRLAQQFYQIPYVSFLPKYFKDVLSMDLGHDSVYLLLILLSGMFSRLFAGGIADALRKKLGLGWSLKIMHSFAMLVPMAAILPLALMPNLSAASATALFSLSFFFFSICSISLNVGANVQYPESSGLFYSLVLQVGSIGAIVVPYVVEVMTVSTTHRDWSNLLLGMTFGCLGLSWVLFMSEQFPEKVQGRA